MSVCGAYVEVSELRGAHCEVGVRCPLSPNAPPTKGVLEDEATVVG